MGLKSFISDPDFHSLLADYGVVVPDSSEVGPVHDALTCAALSAELPAARALYPAIYDPANDELSFYAAGDIYFARITARRPDPIPGYVFISHGSVIVFDSNQQFVEAFFY